MGPGEFLSLAVVVAGTVLIARYVTRIFTSRMQLREREIELALLQSGNRNEAASAATIDKLEARLRVLERIATDKSHTVAAQIEALRDERPAILSSAAEKETA